MTQPRSSGRGAASISGAASAERVISVLSSRTSGRCDEGGLEHRDHLRCLRARPLSHPRNVSVDQAGGPAHLRADVGSCAILASSGREPGAVQRLSGRRSDLVVVLRTDSAGIFPGLRDRRRSLRLHDRQADVAVDSGDAGFDCPRTGDPGALKTTIVPVTGFRGTPRYWGSRKISFRLGTTVEGGGPRRTEMGAVSRMSGTRSGPRLRTASIEPCNARCCEKAG